MKQILNSAAPAQPPMRVYRNGFGKITMSLFLFIAVLLVSNIASATHFRFGVITATKLSETPTTVTYRLNVSTSWRLTAAPPNATFVISGGNSGGVTVNFTTVTDPSGLWENSTGTANVTLNKSSTPTKISFSNCCKISTILNNHDMNWDVYCILNTNAAGNSPVSSMPAIINMAIGASAATFSIPASDPDAGTTLTYGIPNLTSGTLGGETEPNGLTTQNSNFNVNSSTGLVTFNTIGKSVGQQFNAMVTVTDNDGNQIMLDFLINMVGPSNPPVFDYTVTPLNGSVFNVVVGQNLSFPIKATDPDVGQTVSMSVSGLTSFLTTANFSSAALPATGTVSSTNLSYTPGPAELGSTIVLNFIATDNVGVQTTSSVTIKVVGEPAPTFINPTPGESTIRSILAGALHQDDIVAQSSLGSNVSIAIATTPVGVTHSPAIPTPGANPGQTHLSWTPASADFGSHNFSYIATIEATPTIFSTRNFTLIVDDLPVFTSSPVINADACNAYTYNVVATDANTSMGDFVDIVSDVPLPAWLTLTPTGNGTATLSGNPSLSDVGTYTITLTAEDVYHHNYDPVEQTFTITVSAYSITASTGSNGTISDVGTTVVCPGSTPAYVITPDAGYHVADVLVDGSSIGAVTSYTFSSIAANHTITASFAPNCALVASADAAPVYPVPGYSAYTIYLGYGVQTVTLTETVTGGTGYTYSWSPVSGTASTLSVSPSATTTYTVTVTDANGCQISSIKTINVIDVTCCAGKSDVCGKVNVCHGGKALCVAASAVAAHLAHGDHLGGCGAGKGNLTGDDAADDNNGAVNSMRVYPNPAAGTFSVQVPFTSTSLEIQVLDIAGRIIEQKNVTDNAGQTVQFNIANAPKGLYIIKAVSADKSYVSKLMME